MKQTERASSTTTFAAPAESGQNLKELEASYGLPRMVKSGEVFYDES